MTTPSKRIHHYPVSVAWSGGRDGRGELTTERHRQPLSLSAPPEYGGPGEGTNPEELLTSAIAACYAITFGIMAAHRKVPIQTVESKAVGEVEQDGLKFTFTAVRITPRIVLAPEATDEQLTLATELAHRADKLCLVTNAVRDKVAVDVQPEVRVAVGS